MAVTNMLRIPMILILAACLLAACESSDRPEDETALGGLDLTLRSSEHRHDDDLLTAGLGLAGLAGNAPEPAAPESPSASELRRLAIHKAWNGIHSFTPAGGLGGLLDDLPPVPGREFQALVEVAGAVQPSRMLLQLPDAFDRETPCLVVAPASGSRGVYGAIAVAGPWALPRGCAVVYTDKGAGTDFFDYSDGTGVTLAGTRAVRGEAVLGFEPPAMPEDADAAVVAIPHAHSGDNPEADWGRHVLRAAAFGLQVLSMELDQAYSADQVRVIAVGLSNGGGAVLRAAELDDEGLLDAVVALSPNITAPGQPPLFDYATLAALLQPCLLADLDAVSRMPFGNPALVAMGEVRCASLVRAGLLETSGAAAAREKLVAAGLDDRALQQSAVNVALGLWRSVAASYASAYLAAGPFDMPCGYAYRAAEATRAQRQAWWATHSGIGSGEGIALEDGGGGQDPQFQALLCLRALWTGDSDEGERLRKAIEATRASAQLPDIPVIVAHGRDDGLIPVAFSSRPWVAQARAAGARVALWEIERAQHFDVLLAAPGVSGNYVPMLPYGWRALERVTEVLDGRAGLGDDRIVDPDPALAGQALRWQDLGL